MERSLMEPIRTFGINELWVTTWETPEDLIAQFKAVLNRETPVERARLAGYCGA